jgi:acetyl-CoA acetyltransferase
VPLTLADYMNARVIADPIHLYDCVYPCCGADAVVLVSAKTAARLSGPKVRILGGGEIHNYPRTRSTQLSAGWETFRDRMYEQAGFGPGDMHFAQLYDDYPVMEFIQLEGMGFAGRGKGRGVIRSRDCTVRGTFPVNTGGGQLSAGQAGASGGMIGVYEAVLQLRGEAGARQVKCERGVVSGYGAGFVWTRPVGKRVHIGSGVGVKTCRSARAGPGNRRMFRLHLLDSSCLDDRACWAGRIPKRSGTASE